ncbi:MAG TPA: hypothetical protein GXZ27_08205 [Thermoanaerobacterales bacterium]|nr:hypothetical protein [Thermoanaerobacterales bacterium]
MEECRESKGTADCIKTVTVLKMVNIVILSEAKDLRLLTAFRVTQSMNWRVFTCLTVLWLSRKSNNPVPGFT